jgi:hypothetical protein
MPAAVPVSDVDFRCALKCIYQETANYLDRLARAASEGRAVDEANNFLRWLQFSGVLRLLELYASLDPNFRKLRVKCGELQDVCKPHLQGRRMPPSPNEARIDEVNQKVDAILCLMAKQAKVVSPPESQAVDVDATNGRASALLAMPGALDFARQRF